MPWNFAHGCHGGDRVMAQKVHPVLTTADICESAQRQRATLAYEQVVFFSEDIAVAVWNQTLDEATKWDIVGPLELEEVPLDCPLSK